MLIPERCPQCGGEMQATTVVEHYHSRKGEEWDDAGNALIEVRVYCENDHALDISDVAGEELPR